MTDTGLIIAQGLTPGELFSVGTNDHVVTIPISDIFPDQTGHGGEFLQTDGFGNLSWDSAGGGGGGTVTTVSVVTANGVSGSVANATTTPAITLVLGAITPSSVNASGAILGSNLSGTNTGDQTSVTGNAGTATALQTPRTINGVSFDGTANIVVTAAAGTLTGTTLNSSVVTSSLTSVGTIGTGVWNGTTIAIANGGTGQTTAANAINALLPTQTGHSGEFLTTNGTVASWASLGAGVVTSITGTANQVIASAATGAVTLSAPQDIATSSTPQFLRLGVGAAADATASLLLNKSSATTNAAVNTGLFQLNSTGTAANSFGQTWKWQLETSTTDNQDAAQMLVEWSNATHNSRTSRVRFYVVNSASVLTEVFQLGSSFTVAFPQQAQGVLTIQSGGTLTSNTLAGASVIYGSGTGSITGNSTTLTYGTSAGLLASATNIGSISRVTTATNNAVTDALAADNVNSGTSANSIGTGIVFRGKTSTTSSVDLARVAMVQTDVTHASRTAALVISNVYNATAIAEAARIAINATGAQLDIGVAGSRLGILAINGSTSGTTTLKAAAAAGGTFTLPAADGTVGQALITNGSGVLSFGTASTKVFSNTSVPAGNTVANTVVETAFSSSYTIPANALAAGNVLRLKMWGVYSTDVIAPTLRMKVKLGSTVVLDSGAISALVGTSTNLGWSVNADLSWFTIGATGTVDSQAVGEFATAAAAAITINEANTATTTIDTTTTQAITVTITWGTANASNTITMRQFTIEWLK